MCSAVKVGGTCDVNVSCCGCGVAGAPSKLRRGKQSLMARANSQDEDAEQVKIAGHQELRRAFEKIDKAGNGAIDGSEIQALMEELGETGAYCTVFN
jgi:hypothetical protein